jgi:glyoxylase-like metal-dependent hydrolase (beta-lactamase superfamily II)
MFRFTLLLAILFSISAQGRFDAVEIKPIKVSDHVYMFKGAGGNIGVSVGEDGVVIIDSQFEPLHKKIVAEIKKLSKKPVKFLINTHYHGDHTGGNAKFGMKDVTIVAHKNVRKRLPNNRGFHKDALPDVTFNNKIHVHANGDDIDIHHPKNAHTDGDGIVFLKQSNVIHMGDTYFSEKYPYIDVKSGGSIQGAIEAQELGLKLGNDQTKYIPGHGSLKTKADLAKYLEMLRDIRDKVKNQKDAGKSLEDVIASKPTAKYDAIYDGGFIKADALVKAVYTSLN